MSRRQKLQKFSELGLMPNVYQCFDPLNPEIRNTEGQVIQLKGHWDALHFKNGQKLTLELACGRGEYTVALAEAYPQHNFVGVDVKGARIWKGARQALDRKLENAAFLRTRIEIIDRFFAPAEVSEIWITFPDPFLREAKSNRRLTSAYFLEKYRQILASDGVIHLKTDDPTLYAFSLEVVGNHPDWELEYSDDDIYSKELPLEALKIPTYYERQHLAKGRSIKYLRFSPKVPASSAVQSEP